MYNRVAGGFSPPAPTPPLMRVPAKERDSQRLSGRNRIVNVHPQFLDRDQTLFIKPQVRHASLCSQGPG